MEENSMGKGNQNATLNQDLCVKCQEANLPDEKLSTVSDGIAKLIEYSNRIGDKQLRSSLEERVSTDVVKIHRQCQRDVYNTLKRKSLEPACSPTERKGPRRESVNFQWSRDCFYCGKECKSDPHNPGRISWQEVRTLPMRSNILHMCLRKSDEQSEAVKRRLLSVNDLVAAEGRYHKSCRQSFFHKSFKSELADLLTLPALTISMLYASGWNKRERYILW